MTACACARHFQAGNVIAGTGTTDIAAEMEKQRAAWASAAPVYNYGSEAQGAAGGDAMYDSASGLGNQGGAMYDSASGLGNQGDALYDSASGLGNQGYQSSGAFRSSEINETWGTFLVPAAPPHVPPARMGLACGDDNRSRIARHSLYGALGRVTATFLIINRPDQLGLRRGVWHRARAGGGTCLEKEREHFRVGIFLVFVVLTTRAPHVGPQHAQRAKRNRIDRATHGLLNGSFL